MVSFGSATGVPPVNGHGQDGSATPNDTTTGARGVKLPEKKSRVSLPALRRAYRNGFARDNREVLANLFSSVRTISPANLSGSHAILSDPEGPDILSLPGPAITPWIQIGYYVASN